MRFMKINKQENVLHPTYQTGQEEQVVAQSSVGEHLWVGKNHHLTRSEVQKLINRMQKWVDTGSLK
jgi:hypothetical protein